MTKPIKVQDFLNIIDKDAFVILHDGRIGEYSHGRGTAAEHLSRNLCSLDFFVRNVKFTENGIFVEAR